MTLSSELREMLDTKLIRGRPASADPGVAEVDTTRTYASPDLEFKGRIDAIGGRRMRLPEGVRERATHLILADGDEDVAFDDVVAAQDGPYTGKHWRVVNVNPVHAHHLQVAGEELQHLVDGEKLVT